MILAAPRRSRASMWGGGRCYFSNNRGDLLLQLLLLAKYPTCDSCARQAEKPRCSHTMLSMTRFPTLTRLPNTQPTLLAPGRRESNGKRVLSAHSGGVGYVLSPSVHLALQRAHHPSAHLAVRSIGVPKAQSASTMQAYRNSTDGK